MRLLLDTHVFLWYIAADPRLPAIVEAALREASNELFVSVASIWEATIKHGLGKLTLPNAPAVYLSQQRQAHWMASLTIDETTIEELSKLPPLHRDPFDRILVAQAIQHGLTLVSVDQAVQAYPVATFPLR